MSNNEFTCAQCGETFNKGRTDAEALLEKEIFFPGDNNCELVCEDCFKAIMDFREPGLKRYENLNLKEGIQ